MDVSELQAALVKYFAGQSFTETEQTFAGVDLAFEKGNERWNLALCADREEGMAYLGAFEAAMQKMVDLNQAPIPEVKLGLGIAFGSAAAGKHPSYRRALKKYSNSVVFEDLNLYLFLVDNDGEILELEPSGVNPFLRDLDRWIVARQ